MKEEQVNKAIEAMNEAIGKNSKELIEEEMKIKQGKIIGKEFSYSNQGVKERLLTPEEVLKPVEETSQVMDIPGERDKKGRFLPGHQISKGNKSVKLDKQALIEAMRTVETLKKKPFLEKVFEMAYKYPQVMNKILDKFFADLSIAEIKGGSGIYNVFITKFIEEKEKREKLLNPENVINIEENGSPPSASKEVL